MTWLQRRDDVDVDRWNGVLRPASLRSTRRSCAGTPRSDPERRSPAAPRLSDPGRLDHWTIERLDLRVGTARASSSPNRTFANLQRPARGARRRVASPNAGEPQPTHGGAHTHDQPQLLIAVSCAASPRSDAARLERRVATQRLGLPRRDYKVGPGVRRGHPISRQSSEAGRSIAASGVHKRLGNSPAFVRSNIPSGALRSDCRCSKRPSSTD